MTCRGGEQSVRGTASVVDGLEDLDLWSEALQLELVSMVFPFVFTWPDSSTAALVEVPPPGPCDVNHLNLVNPLCDWSASNKFSRQCPI